jgi:hypothetical protein
MRDDELPVLTTMQTARGGAAFHVIRYRTSNDPLDYLIAYQAGFLLRLFQNPPERRFDFVPDPAAHKAESLIAAPVPRYYECLNDVWRMYEALLLHVVEATDDLFGKLLGAFCWDSPRNSGAIRTAASLTEAWIDRLSEDVFTVNCFANDALCPAHAHQSLPSSRRTRWAK